MTWKHVAVILSGVALAAVAGIWAPPTALTALVGVASAVVGGALGHAVQGKVE